ncbi:MAG: deoxyguanosinetriphosphate triphosphohydrolase family protein [Coprobacillaceae bacterium]
MTKLQFKNEAMVEGHPNYEIATTREESLYGRRNDIRSDFGRDYTRIVFSQGYRRMKHKTQVFFAVENDHVCTRSEHVNLVESVSYSIAKYLGLNTELTKAISVGHDLGHAPFGHGGEKIIANISKQYDLDPFWHEKNSLHFVDEIETLEDNEHIRRNLNLTYAVRDGIISHCGEVNQLSIKRREETIDLKEYKNPGQYNPYTWEGCVVKMADKIAYLARDIEDALRLHIISDEQVNTLRDTLNAITKEHKFTAINNGTIVNYFILDVCLHSTLEKGISLSKEAHTVMRTIMEYNYKNIYLIDRVKIHSNYVQLILDSIFTLLHNYYQESLDSSMNIIELLQRDEKLYPKTITSFSHWLVKYSIIDGVTRPKEYQNKAIYDFINDDKAIIKSIIDFLSGMSDAYIIQIFNELISF